MGGGTPTARVAGLSAATCRTHVSSPPSFLWQLGPELEIPGYGCEDHFSENDTVEHSWECVARLLAEGHTAGLVVDVGAPVVHRGVRYNCRLFLLDGRVLLIRPKLHLAGDGNYREPRYFSTWKRGAGVEEHTLPGVVRAATGQRTCPFGHAALAFSDAVLASESCEELFTPRAPHIDLALAGVEIITNGSGSHHQMRKLHTVREGTGGWGLTGEEEEAGTGRRGGEEEKGGGHCNCGNEVGAVRESEAKAMAVAPCKPTCGARLSVPTSLHPPH